MAEPDDPRLGELISRLALAESHEAQEDIGRSELASLIHARPALLEAILTAARRDARMRRCLSAARYYAGLDQATCDRIDAVLHRPFPAAGRPHR